MGKRKWYVALIQDHVRTIVEFDNREFMFEALEDWKRKGIEILCVWSEEG